MVELYSDKNIDGVAGVESRGFLFAAPLADRLKIPLVLIRKRGKLPGDTYKCKYALEYGTAEIEAHKCDIEPGLNYLIVDDLIATGGTLVAARNLIEQGGGRGYIWGHLKIPPKTYPQNAPKRPPNQERQAEQLQDIGDDIEELEDADGEENTEAESHTANTENSPDAKAPTAHKGERPTS